MLSVIVFLYAASGVIGYLVASTFSPLMTRRGVSRRRQLWIVAAASAVPFATASVLEALNGFLGAFGVVAMGAAVFVAMWITMRANGLLNDPRNVEKEWDFSTMQPRKAWAMWRSPLVDWRHDEGPAFLHLPSNATTALKYGVPALCIRVAGGVETLEPLAVGADQLVRGDGTLYAEVGLLPDGTRVRSARVWAAENDSELRIVVSYLGAPGNWRGQVSYSFDTDAVVECFKAVARLTLRTSSEQSRAMALADARKLEANVSGEVKVAEVPKVKLVLLGVLAVVCVAVLSFGAEIIDRFL